MKSRERGAMNFRGAKVMATLRKRSLNGWASLV
jgi:hypothetical protein